LIGRRRPFWTQAISSGGMPIVRDQ
jgi:hypothetical protein